MTAYLRERVDAVFGLARPIRLGVAVSGGGDSVALLSVLVGYARDHGIALHVVSVDHGVRPEAKQEISFVADLCRRWDLQHHVEYWTGWNGEGNFSAKARDARYALMADWACANDITHIALGHTADDQAETVLLRLLRGAGLQGLAAMPASRELGLGRLERPLPLRPCLLEFLGGTVRFQRHGPQLPRLWYGSALRGLGRLGRLGRDARGGRKTELLGLGRLGWLGGDARSGGTYGTRGFGGFRRDGGPGIGARWLLGRRAGFDRGSLRKVCEHLLGGHGVPRRLDRKPVQLFERSHVGPLAPASLRRVRRL